MAQPPARHAEALIARIEASRATLTTEAHRLRHRLDVPARLKDSVLSKPLAWFGGSLGAGLAASLLFRGRRRRERRVAPVAKRSLLAVLAGGLFTLIRPLLQEWALGALKNRIVVTTNPPSRKD